MATQFVTLSKDSQNLIGISIGGGSPYCPCLYVVQVFDDTPASREGSLGAGDEIVAVNHANVRGMTRTELAALIQSHKKHVGISFIKLPVDDKVGNSFDICLKKLKHRMVEQMSSATADVLGLSRAILVNDSMVRKLQELSDQGSTFYKLMALLRRYLKNLYDLSRVYRAFGEVFSDIAVHEPQAQASEAFREFSNAHRNMEKYAFTMLRKIKPLVTDFNIFIRKVIPDTQLTVKRYLDTKFEYLSYCLKVKEMDDEEYSFHIVSDNLLRVETGNFEYRYILHNRQESRARFAKLRNDVLVKIELIDNKHVQDTVAHLGRLLSAILEYRMSCADTLRPLSSLFPIEVDLAARVSALETPIKPDEDDYDDFSYNFDEFEPKENSDTEDQGNLLE